MKIKKLKTKQDVLRFIANRAFTRGRIVDGLCHEITRLWHENRISTELKSQVIRYIMSATRDCFNASISIGRFAFVSLPGVTSYYFAKSGTECKARAMMALLLADELDWEEK